MFTPVDNLQQVVRFYACNVILATNNIYLNPQIRDNSKRRQMVATTDSMSS